MQYNILDFFMIRTSAKSISKYVDELTTQEIDEDIFNLFFENKKIQEVIQVSSYSLYKSLKEKNGDNEQKRLSLKHYISRMCSRTTPYGLLTGVSFGEFGNTTVSLENSLKKNLRVDMEWLYPVIRLLESENYNNLFVIWNEECLEMGNKLVIDWNTCLIHNTNDVLKIGNVSHINFTEAVKIVRKNCGNFVRISDILHDLQERYPMVTFESITNFLENLFEKEYLISNLRGNMLENDLLKKILCIIDESDYRKSELVEKLEYISLLISKYNKTEIGKGIELYDLIISEMSSVFKTKNLLRTDLIGKEALILEKSAKKQLLDLIEFLRSQSIDYYLPPGFNIWCNNFLERYSNTEQKLVKVISDIDGIGLPKYGSDTNINIVSDDNIKQELDYYINVKNKKSNDYVQLSEFSVFSKRKSEDPFPDDNSLELAFYIQEKNGEKIFSLSPMIGNDNAGSTIGRFLYGIEKSSDLMNSLQNLNEDYDEVEIVYYPQIERIGNIVNTKSNRRYILEFGSNAQNNHQQKLFLSDILINVGEYGIYFKHKKTGRRLRFFMNHATRLDFAPPIAQLLINAEKYKRKETLSLLYQLNTIVKDYVAVPRIMYNSIIIREKTWKIVRSRFSNLNEEEFMKEFYKYIEEVELDRFVFLQEFDNRILLDIFDKDSVKTIYKKYKKGNDVFFVENIFTGDFLLKNEESDPILAELVFYFQHKNSSFTTLANEYQYKDITKIKNKYIPFDEYVYLKIYSNPLFEDELLQKVITPFCLECKEKNWIDFFYFIRYGDPNNHLRLRFKLSSNGKENSIFHNSLNRFMKKLNESNFCNNLTIDTYIPEVKRYGGELVYSKVEETFFLNSMVVLKLTDLIKNESYDISKIDIGILLVTRLILDTQMGLESAYDFTKHFEDKSKNKREFRNKRVKYLNFLKRSEEKSDMEINSIIDIQKDALEELWNELNLHESELTNKKEDILSSLIHMSCNRLFGTNRETEAFVRNMCAKTIYSYKAYLKNINHNTYGG